MGFLKFTRHTEWYEPKIIPLLSIGYLVIYLNNYALDNTILRLLFLIFSIAIGAVYVSVINDVSDIEVDAAAGKKNIMQNRTKGQIALILGVCYAIGLYCCYRLWPDKLSMLFYTMAWIVFSLYSFHPFRFKERGMLGVFADAMGAHLFPTLVIICNLPFIMGNTPDLTWTIITAVWALAYGLRGILWHQFYDRENDLSAQIKTFATEQDPEKFRPVGLFIFLIEIACFSFMIYTVFNIWLLLSVVIYLLLILIRKTGLYTGTIIILQPKNSSFRIMMHDYYLALFPLAILLSIAFQQKYGWILLCAHLLLFPRPVYVVIKDFLIVAKNSLGIQKYK